MLGRKALVVDDDVIILDLMMPRITGQGVVEFLTRTRPDYVSRIIAITAFGKPQALSVAFRICHSRWLRWSRRDSPVVTMSSFVIFNSSGSV